MVYAYARVSSKEQNTARQMDAFGNQPEIDRIFEEKASGKDFSGRKVYQKLRRKLRRGDTLIVMSLDRFGRNYDEIICEWRHLVKNVGCNIKVLDMPILDTTSGNGLIGRFISDLVLQILSFVAQSERDKIRERQAQGIAAAKARGVKFGRPKRLITDEQMKVIEEMRNGNISIRACSNMTGISRTYLCRKSKEWRR